MTTRATDLDRLIGQNIRAAREQRRMTQAELGAALGISFQQVQNYEHGRRRVFVSRLFDIGRILNVPLDSFFLTAKP